MAAPLKGKWRIVEMELWDSPAVDLQGPAFIEFLADGFGRFRFIAVTGDIDWRQERSRVEFSWCGFDEMDPASGRGWVKLKPDGMMQGRLYFHHGDSSDFTAARVK